MVTDRIDAALIAAAPRLRVISNLAVGLDNIDVAAATAAGIAIGHTPGVLTDATADLAFALLMATARRVTEGDREVRAGKWQTWGPSVLLGRMRVGRDARHHRMGPDRARDGAAWRRLQHARRVCEPLAEATTRRSRARRECR